VRLGRRVRAALLAGAALAACARASSGADPLAALKAALERGDLPAAVRAGEAAVAADPQSSEANDLLGRAYGLTARDARLLEQMHLARKARVCFARAVELDPRNVAALSDLARYDMRAPGILGGGRKKAREAIARVAALDPVRGHVLAGELAEAEKEPARAEAEYRAAVAADPASSRGRVALSAFFVTRQDYGQARRVWSEAGEPQASSTLAAYELGGIALASGQWLPEAAERLEGALGHPDPTEDPSPAVCHERLAAIYEKLGKKREAAVQLEAALHLEPARADWRERLDRLEK